MAVRRRRTRRNVEMGYWSGGVFHPIRASDDYDAEDVGERYQYAPAKKKKKKKKNASIHARKMPFFLPAKRKPARKKNAKRPSAKTLMRSGSQKLAAWVRSQTKKNPTRVDATVTGNGTGWIKAKAVRVRKEGGRYKVEVKR